MEVVLICLLSLYVAVNLGAVVQRFFAFRFRRRDYTRAGTLLVVVAHQDDETAVAGGAIRKTIEKGGEVFVVYTTDGVTRGPRMSPERIEADISCRERQAINCLASVGVPSRNVSFLRIESELGLTRAEIVAEAATWLAWHIDRIRPYAVVTSSFEGGHPDHDMTNFIVARAVAWASHLPMHVLEAPEYNRYYLRESFIRYMNRILLVKYWNPPRFVPRDAPRCVLAMSSDEVRCKKEMFRHFATYNPPELVKMFGYPDQYRRIPTYDYAKGPFRRDRTVRALLAGVRYRGSGHGLAFFRNLTLSHYHSIYMAAEEACARAPEAFRTRQVSGIDGLECETGCTKHNSSGGST